MVGEGVSWMNGMNGSGNKLSDARRALGRIWADVSYGQQRLAELNRPWMRPRHRPTAKG